MWTDIKRIDDEAENVAKFVFSIYLAGHQQRFDGKWFPVQHPWRAAQRTADWLIAKGHVTPAQQLEEPDEQK